MEAGLLHCRRRHIRVLPLTRPKTANSHARPILGTGEQPKGRAATGLSASCHSTGGKTEALKKQYRCLRTNGELTSTKNT